MSWNNIIPAHILTEESERQISKTTRYHVQTVENGFFITIPKGGIFNTEREAIRRARDIAAGQTEQVRVNRLDFDGNGRFACASEVWCSRPIKVTAK